MMVGRRKRLLSYLKGRDLEGYRALIKKTWYQRLIFKNEL